MAGRSGRTYVRDSNGRFASGGGGGGGGKRAASGGKGKGKAAPAAGAAAPKRGKGKAAPAAAPAPAAPAPAPKNGKAAPPASTKGRFTRVFTGAVSRLGQRKIAAPVRAAEQKLRQAQMNAGSYGGALKARAAKSALSRAKNKAAVAARAARVKSAVRGNSGIYGTKASGPKGVLSGTVAKPKGLKPGEVTARTSKPRPGIVNGVRIHQGFDPWRTFGLNGKTATKQDVERAYRKVARQTHPDAGGNRKDFERVKLMRDSLMAIWDSGESSKRSGGKGKSKGGAAAAAPQGPRMLPPARTAAAPAPAAPKKARSGGRGKGKSKAS